MTVWSGFCFEGIVGTQILHSGGKGFYPWVKTEQHNNRVSIVSDYTRKINLLCVSCVDSRTAAVHRSVLLMEDLALSTLPSKLFPIT